MNEFANNTRILPCVAVLLVIIASASGVGATAKPELPISETLGGDFTLTRHPGESGAVRLQDYRGKVVLLAFGYTHCPDFCPLTLSRLKQLMEQLGSLKHEVQTLFVTFDPERDTPERLQTYVSYFDPSFIGLTGTEGDLSQVMRQYGVLSMKLESTSSAGYTFAHSDYMYLIDRQGRLRTRYKSEVPLDGIASDIKHLLSSTASTSARKGQP